MSVVRMLAALPAVAVPVTAVAHAPEAMALVPSVAVPDATSGLAGIVSVTQVSPVPGTYWRTWLVLLQVSQVLYCGVATPLLVQFENTVLAPAAPNVKVWLGFTVDEATLVVNSGDRLPDVNDCTVPVPAEIVAQLKPEPVVQLRAWLALLHDGTAR